jgi:thiol-disulfide isomerase/thioredoxin
MQCDANSRCGPCKMISPIFEKMSEETPTVEFVKVDVDEAEEIAAGKCASLVVDGLVSVR